MVGGSGGVLACYLDDGFIELSSQLSITNQMISSQYFKLGMKGYIYRLDIRSVVYY
jgi:hypothetical protein